MMELIIAVVVGAIVFAVIMVRRGKKDDKQAAAPAEKPPKRKPGYWINIGYHSWDVYNEIVNRLPNIDSTLFRWELYVDRPEHNPVDYLYIKIFQVHTGDVVAAERFKIGCRRYGQSWTSLEGCSKSFMRDKIHEDIIAPAQSWAISAASKAAGIKPAVRLHQII